MKELNFQVETLETNKNKLRSGLIRLAGCLFKREPSNSPLSDILKEIIQNLKSVPYDSEESLKYLCSLFDKIGDLDDFIQQKHITEPEQKHVLSACSAMAVSVSTNSALPSDASLQKLVTSYQPVDFQNCQVVNNENQKKPGLHAKGQDRVFGVNCQMKRGQSQDEDMYGPEDILGDTDLVPYNLVRLHKKLTKLQQFPTKYRSMAQFMVSRSSFEQQGSATCKRWTGEYIL